jgi:UDP-N-acetylmuramate--alanine ligase
LSFQIHKAIIQTNMNKDREHVHIVGVRGMGTSSLAVIQSERGSKVTGSDEVEISVADHLLKKHPEITIYDSFNEKHVAGVDLVVRSVAYDEQNSEVKAALSQNIEVLTYPQAVGRVLQEYSAIAVAGCNGKTTTAGMIALMLRDGGVDASYIVGAALQGGIDNAHLGRSKFFVIEADEYRDAFHNYSPRSEFSVVTNIDHDHPDYFPTMEDIVDSFKEFVDRTPSDSTVLVCGDDEGNKQLLALLDRQVSTYGFSESNDWVISNVDLDESRSRFVLNYHNRKVGSFELSIPGKHNVLNASAAIAVGTSLGINSELIADSLKRYKGAKRRFEVLYDEKDVAIVDDYAHHPMAIEATIKAARQRYPDRKIVSVFQPHTYSRTQLLLNEFAKSLAQSDEVFLMDIYGSVRERSENFSVTIKDLISRVRQEKDIVAFSKDPDGLIEQLLEKRDKPTVFLTMGAGDVWKVVGESLREELRKNG